MEAITKDFLFILTIIITLGGASVTAFSKSIVYAAVGLIFALLGVAGLFIFLSADFIAVAQVMIYVGGVVILILFAILLTKGFDGFIISNPQMNGVPAFVVSVFLLGTLIFTLFKAPLFYEVAKHEATTKKIGNLLLSKYVLPFELASVLIVVIIIGAAVMVRKELIVSPKTREESIEDSEKGGEK